MGHWDSGDDKKRTVRYTLAIDYPPAAPPLLKHDDSSELWLELCTGTGTEAKGRASKYVLLTRYSGSRDLA